jgi:membrane protein YdbS with pleckstrin-like domain
MTAAPPEPVGPRSHGIAAAVVVVLGLIAIEVGWRLVGPRPEPWMLAVAAVALVAVAVAVFQAQRRGARSDPGPDDG